MGCLLDFNQLKAFDYVVRLGSLAKLPVYFRPVPSERRSGSHHGRKYCPPNKRHSFKPRTFLPLYSLQLTNSAIVGAISRIESAGSCGYARLLLQGRRQKSHSRISYSFEGTSDRKLLSGLLLQIFKIKNSCF